MCAIKALAEYKPFGEFRLTPTITEEGYYFTDQYNDPESGLYYYGARYYNPEVGRFITPDWIVQAPGNSQSLNRYSYTWNNPVNMVDPSGNMNAPIMPGLGSLPTPMIEPDNRPYTTPVIDPVAITHTTPSSVPTSTTLVTPISEPVSTMLVTPMPELQGSTVHY